jgi:hypothetical protein
MKPFQSYIFELNKPYEFRIKIATVNPKGEVMDKIKHALETFQLESVSPVKSLPIMEHVEFHNGVLASAGSLMLKLYTQLLPSKYAK